MRYWATNGIVTAVLTEAEAREHYDRAQFVRGEFGKTFVTCPVGEYGHVLSVAMTMYTPIPDERSPEVVRPPRTPGRGSGEGAP
jgi:hypothetical protein